MRVESTDLGSNPPTLSVIARVDMDGDIFDAEKVEKGLANLRDAYGGLGYINLTTVPDMQIDKEAKLIYLTIGIDEGAPFYVSSVAVKTADRSQEAALLALWPDTLRPGSVYNSSLVKKFFRDAQSLLPSGSSPEKNLTVEQDFRKHTLDLVVSVESKQ